MKPPASAPQTAHPNLTLKLLISLLKETWEGYSKHRVAKMAAALSYYTAFSLAPLVVFILSVASLAVQKDVASHAIMDQATSLLGEKGGEAIADILQNAGSPTMASWGAILSLIVLLIGASGVFGELQDSLNQIWEITAPDRPFLQMLQGRLLSFTMVFVLGFLMLTSLIVSAVIAEASKYFSGDLSVVGLELVNTTISLVVISTLFAVIYRLLPDIEIDWNEVWPGAIFTASLFILGKALLGWYVARSAMSSSYGAAGSFVVILFWVFYSSQIMFIGAEFTRAYTRQVLGKKTG